MPSGGQRGLQGVTLQVSPGVPQPGSINVSGEIRGGGTILAGGNVYTYLVESYGDSPYFRLLGKKVGGNEWRLKAIDTNGRFSIIDQITGDEAFSIHQGALAPIYLSKPLFITNGMYVNGALVVKQRQAAVSDAAGGAVVDVEARAAINALLARLRAGTGHGLID